MEGDILTRKCRLMVSFINLTLGFLLASLWFVGGPMIFGSKEAREDRVSALDFINNNSESREEFIAKVREGMIKHEKNIRLTQANGANSGKLMRKRPIENIMGESLR